MPYRILFAARHGETDWNAAGRLQGHTDVPLNDLGRAQARALAERLRAERVAAVITSDLSRARETGAIVAAELGAQIAYADHELRERAFGIFEGLTREQLEATHAEAWRAWKEHGTPPPGGETNEVLARRVVAALVRAAESLADARAAALVVSHGAALRFALQTVTGRAMAPIANAVAFKLVVERGALRVEDD